MSRLTKRNADGTAWYNHTVEKQIGNGEILEKLTHYEDLEEQGRLIELPCKVGDTVYVVVEVFNGKETVPMIGSRKIDSISGNSLNPVWMVSKEPYQMNFVPSAFGVRVFTTKEEAEAKVVELKEGEK